MGRYFNFYHYFLIVPLLLLYGNCDGYKSTTGTNQSSLSNCTNSASLSLKLLKFNPQNDCDQLSLVQCEKRIFGPEQENGEQDLESCLQNSAYGDVCLNLVERSYNTNGASDLAEDYLVGAQYNYEEVNCYMDRFSHDQKPIFKSSEPTLVASLASLHEQCIQGGRQ